MFEPPYVGCYFVLSFWITRRASRQKNSRALFRLPHTIRLMAVGYDELLEATIQHLQELKGRGVRFVSASPGTLSALATSKVQGTGFTARKHEAKTQPPDVKFPKLDVAKLATKPITPATSVSQSGVLEVPGEKTASSTPALTPEAKMAAFADLRQRATACVKCSHLASSRKNVVFGVGDINAQLMFVGEAPGADEDIQGEPFVGKAGQLLTKIIETMGLRRESVYIANILKCRPDTPGQASGNRKPTPEEMQTCIPFLHEQIDLIKPRVLVALGGTAVEGLLGKTVGIMKLRGNWQTYRGIPLMPTYHPAYVLRNQALTEKRRVWEDMMMVMDKLGMPISDKQRKFFTKP
jgi:uracil-DNA glycosylase